MYFSVITLKQGLMLFWALWLSVVCLGNFFDLLKHVGILGAGWKFASGNYDLMQKSTRLYRLPETAVRVLFMGVIVWEALAALLMGSALISFNGLVSDSIYAAFGVSLALWAAFMIADEILAAYEVETVHVRFFIAQIVSLLALCLLPSVGQ